VGIAFFAAKAPGTDKILALLLKAFFKDSPKVTVIGRHEAVFF
jgi:hypothetical protein